VSGALATQVAQFYREHPDDYSSVGDLTKAIDDWMTVLSHLKGELE
jgi:hypothetical protein